jgi:hypothetical protein
VNKSPFKKTTTTKQTKKKQWNHLHQNTCSEQVRLL